MKIPRRPRPAPYIPFISLADIAWQIIIFFLIASTFAKNYSLNVAMPSASATVEQSLRKTLTVEVSEAKLSVNGVNVPLADLERYVGALLAGKTSEEDRAVIVIPDDDLSFQRNADVLYAVQKAGGVIVISEEHHRENPAQAK